MSLDFPDTLIYASSCHKPSCDCAKAHIWDLCPRFEDGLLDDSGLVRCACCGHIPELHALHAVRRGLEDTDEAGTVSGERHLEVLALLERTLLQLAVTEADLAQLRDQARRCALPGEWPGKHPANDPVRPPSPPDFIVPSSS